jgi:hypothetical protein
MSVVVVALALAGALFLFGSQVWEGDSPIFLAGKLGQSPSSSSAAPKAEQTAVMLPPELGRWVVGVLSIYMACVALSICAVIWVLTPEIFPNRVRGRAVSIATLTNWSTNAASTFLFPWYVDRYGMHVGFLSFAVICFVGTAFFWRYVPETKGRSLEEIEKSWSR